MRVESSGTRGVPPRPESSRKTWRSEAEGSRRLRDEGARPFRVGIHAKARRQSGRTAARLARKGLQRSSARPPCWRRPVVHLGRGALRPASAREGRSRPDQAETWSRGPPGGGAGESPTGLEPVHNRQLGSAGAAVKLAPGLDVEDLRRERNARATANERTGFSARTSRTCRRPCASVAKRGGVQDGPSRSGRVAVATAGGFPCARLTQVRLRGPLLAVGSFLRCDRPALQVHTVLVGHGIDCRRFCQGGVGGVGGLGAEDRTEKRGSKTAGVQVRGECYRPDTRDEDPARRAVQERVPAARKWPRCQGPAPSRVGEEAPGPRIGGK